MALLNEKKSKVAPNTLWGISSMLKSTLLAYHNVNLGEYTSLTSFLKQNAVGYKPKKAKIFLKEDMDKFLLTAPDDSFLMKKVTFLVFLLLFIFIFIFRLSLCLELLELVDKMN